MRMPRLPKQEKGMTIVELLIALPIASIIIIILMSALFTQYTQTLAESSRSNLRTAGQTLLINLQDELLFTIAYGEGLESRLVDAHQPAGGWKHNTTPDETLIINEIALDSTRRDDDRHILRERLNPCESSRITDNPVAINNVIYYVKDTPNSEYKSLHKRTITPTYNLCGIDSTTDGPCTPVQVNCRGNAKKTTCEQANIGSGGCEERDSILSENVVSMDITYYAEGNVETAFPSAADKVEILLVLGDKVYGKKVEAEVKHTIRKIN